MIDTSEMAFPKPVKKQKKSSFKKKVTKKPEEVIMFENEVYRMVMFYESHRDGMESIDNYKFTKKLQKQMSQWVSDVMLSQKVENPEDVVQAWQLTVLHAAEKVHQTHKDKFLNFWWLIKNDANYLDVLNGKYDKEFKDYGQTKKSGKGNPEDFINVSGGASGIVV